MSVPCKMRPRTTRSIKASSICIALHEMSLSQRLPAPLTRPHSLSILDTIFRYDRSIHGFHGYTLIFNLNHEFSMRSGELGARGGRELGNEQVEEIITAMPFWLCKLIFSVRGTSTVPILFFVIKNYTDLKAAYI